MNVLNHERLNELLEHRSTPCVSLFMPTHRSGHERQQDSIRLKNLVGRAERRVREEVERLEAGAVRDMLAPVTELKNDDDFWRHRSDALACFCADGFFQAYRLPLNLEEQLYVNERFYIRPLLPLMRGDSRLYVLSLTQSTARLFEATKYSIRELQLPRISPLELDAEEQSLQYHSHRSPGQGKGETETAMYHGHGGPTDRAKKDTLRYFQRVERAVTRMLRGQRAPLVLACVGYQAQIYETANHYGHLIKEKIPGSPDRWSEDELRDHAWKLVEPYFRRKQQDAWRTFRQSVGKDIASDDLRTVVLGAGDGRIDTLFLARSERRWGHVDPRFRAVHVTGEQREGEELLDYAAVNTLSNGGDVFLLDTLPDTDSPVAATFRY